MTDVKRVYVASLDSEPSLALDNVNGGHVFAVVATLESGERAVLALPVAVANRLADMIISGAGWPRDPDWADMRTALERQPGECSGANDGTCPKHPHVPTDSS